LVQSGRTVKGGTAQIILNKTEPNIPDPSCHNWISFLKMNFQNMCLPQFTLNENICKLTWNARSLVLWVCIPQCVMRPLSMERDPFLATNQTL